MTILATNINNEIITNRNNLNMLETNNEMLYNNNNINPYIFNNIFNNIPVKKCKSNTPLTEKWKKSINVIKNNIHCETRCVTRDEIRDETTPNNIQKKLLQHLLILVEKTQEEVTLLKEKKAELHNTNNMLQDRVVCLEQQISDLLTDDNQCSVCMAQKKNSAFIVCGHLCVCSECAPKCRRSCPLCQTKGGFIKIYQ